MIKKCKNCACYPDDCGYWGKKYRQKNKTASFLSEEAKHNCRDFIRGRENGYKIKKVF